MIGQRVRDKISDQTGTVKGTFWNQAIVQWDQPDENGDYISSVPLTDLQEENDAGSPAKKNTDAATETPADSKGIVMTDFTRPESYLNEKTRANLDSHGIPHPVTVRQLGDAAHALGVMPSEMLKPSASALDYSGHTPGERS